jgi:hypothetical protein
MADEFFHAGGQTYGRTDTHDEANSRFSQFCENGYSYLKIIRVYYGTNNLHL